MENAIIITFKFCDKDYYGDQNSPWSMANQVGSIEDFAVKNKINIVHHFEQSDIYNEHSVLESTIIQEMKTYILKSKFKIHYIITDNPDKDCYFDDQFNYAIQQEFLPLGIVALLSDYDYGSINHDYLHSKLRDEANHIICDYPISPFIRHGEVLVFQKEIDEFLKDKNESIKRFCKIASYEYSLTNTYCYPEDEELEYLINNTCYFNDRRTIVTNDSQFITNKSIIDEMCQKNIKQINYTGVLKSRLYVIQLYLERNYFDPSKYEINRYFYDQDDILELITPRKEIPSSIGI